ncbi:Iron-regulated surface determinant protein B [Streptococcus infantarius subsp. infantarius]|nr:Iron-regulated surface determinant protein B [Streptococcus infantarius subsp. infantarius]
MRRKQQDFRTEKYIRYGIRKFSFGAASVAIAVGLMFLGNGVVSATEVQPGNEGTATGVAPTASAQPGNEGTATGVAPTTSAQPGNEGTATGVAPTTSAQPGNEGTATGVAPTSKSSDSAGVQAETQKGTPTVPTGTANADGKTQYSSEQLPVKWTMK